MSIGFRRVETGAMRHISMEEGLDSYKPESRIVPDLTGDRIPDFFEIRHVGRHSPGHEGAESYDAGTYTMLLTNGAYGTDGKLVKSGNPIVLATHQWSAANRSEGVNHITDVQFADYNVDGLMDISFWQFVNPQEGFRQVILFGQRS